MQFRLLIVDDHPDIREMLSTTFKLRGHAVESAGSVTEALALIAKQPFDLLIADWSLPDGTGADLMKAVRARCSLKGIVLSAYSAEQIAGKWQAAGFTRVLDKFSNLDAIAKAAEDVAAEK